MLPALAPFFPHMLKTSILLLTLSCKGKPGLIMTYRNTDRRVQGLLCSTNLVLMEQKWNIGNVIVSDLRIIVYWQLRVCMCVCVCVCVCLRLFRNSHTNCSWLSVNVFTKKQPHSLQLATREFTMKQPHFLLLAVYDWLHQKAAALTADNNSKFLHNLFLRHDADCEFNLD